MNDDATCITMLASAISESPMERYPLEYLCCSRRPFAAWEMADAAHLIWLIANIPMSGTRSSIYPEKPFLMSLNAGDLGKFPDRPSQSRNSGKDPAQSLSGSGKATRALCKVNRFSSSFLSAHVGCTGQTVDLHVLVYCEDEFASQRTP